jgi:hypothetical protein
MEWVGYIAHMREIRYAYKILVGKSEGNILLRRPAHRWNNNINMDFKEMACEVMNWIHLAQDKGPVEGLGRKVTSLRIP